MIFPPLAHHDTLLRGSSVDAVHAGVTRQAGDATRDRRHILTVALEDYYHVGAFNQLVQRGEWYRFESRLAVGTRRTLDLLDAHGVKATFFALGWVADLVPELVREVSERGHEVASKGYYHRRITGMSPEEFRDDLSRARESLERASGRRVLGYRVAGDWLHAEDLWALDILAGEGYAYDSSLSPFARELVVAQRAGQHVTANGPIWEVPVSTTRLPGFRVPIGGNYLRQLPFSLMRWGATARERASDAPLVLYFHTWELDPDQPRITAARAVQRLRHYRNLGRMAERIGWFLERWSFTSAAEHLGLRPAEVPTPELRRAQPTRPAVVVAERPSGDARVPVTVVVPCYNEELILPYLSNTLQSVEERLGGRYDLRFLFVDDGSSDGTRAALERIFGGKERHRVTQMPRNSGVAAAILHGVHAAETEIVCSIDCDCTYDPHELGRMIPLLGDDVSMVTASPYHAHGMVRNVAGWRLFLSRGVSRLYRLVMRNQLATYTSCFRVYRRSALDGLRLDRWGFLGITEMLGRLDLAGHRIVEFPATLEVRMMGRSKLRVLRAIAGHLSLIAKLATLRVVGGDLRVPAAPPAEEP